MGEKFNEEGINQKRKAKSGKRKLKRGVGTGPEARGDGKIKANGGKKGPPVYAPAGGFKDLENKRGPAR